MFLAKCKVLPSMLIAILCLSFGWVHYRKQVFMGCFWTQCLKSFLYSAFVKPDLDTNSSVKAPLVHEGTRKLEQVQQSPPRFLGVWSICCTGTGWGSGVYLSLEIFSIRLDKELSNLFWSHRGPCFEQGDGLQTFGSLSLPTWIIPWFSDSKIQKFTGCMTQLGLEMDSDLH